MKNMGSRNEAALTLRKVQFLFPEVSHEIAELDSLTKRSPYFGFVDIEISDNALFSMFSNNDDFVAQAYFWKGKDAYEATSLKIWSTLAKKASHIVDVGAYSGVYCLSAAKTNPKSKVYAIEALDRVYSRLLINKNANSTSNLKCFNFAMSDQDSEVELLVYSGEDILVSGSSTVAEVTDRKPCEKKIIKGVRLDTFIAEKSISKVELLKIDAEGAEHLILNGAEQLISSSKPDIICELLPTSELSHISKSLGFLGYRYYKISESSLLLKEYETPPASIEPPDFNILMTTKSSSELEAALPFLSFDHLN
ncbi:FkbM family methyltransferase [Pseudomonas kielensis]|uniref:FkbM family methyltransferase n=1 Tax=Pseudomonas kielensis TaxID=2762577 RepID=UPI00223FBB7C|nr:FkbM family methyltransferase [Pseudomonas kielensis]UZM16116.1 FkbM family methyltransferase [Pseudomonas kielensis]